jgi:hypothetical protein
MVRRRGDVGQRRGGTGEGKERRQPIGLTRILLSQKIKKIHAIDSAATNGRWRFKITMS